MQKQLQSIGTPIPLTSSEIKMKRLIWLLLLVSTVGCTTVKATPSVDTSKQDLEFEMALQNTFKSLHQEEMTAIEAQAGILARIEAAVASVDSKIEGSGTPLDPSEEENGTNTPKTDPNTPSTTTEPSKSTSEPIPEENTDDYVVMLTAPYCGVCTSWKANQLIKRQNRFFLKAHPTVRVRIVDIEDVNDPESVQWKSQVSSLPTFLVADGVTRTVRQRYIGFTDGGTLLQKVRLRGKDRVSVAPTSNSNCSPSCSCGCTTGGSCNCNPQSSLRSTRSSTVRWGNGTYSGRVCNNPRCTMCNQIESALRYQSRYIPLELQSAPQAPPSPATLSQEPTPDVTLNHMIDLLKLTDKDVLADLGCGDGRILIEAVNRYGCNAVGVEIDPVKAKEARRKVYDAGLASKIEIIEGDALDFDPSEHGVTALTMYLYPDLLAKLKPKFDSVRIGASPFHQVPGLAMTNHEDVWIYQPSI